MLDKTSIKSRKYFEMTREEFAQALKNKDTLKDEAFWEYVEDMQRFTMKWGIIPSMGQITE